MVIAISISTIININIFLIIYSKEEGAYRFAANSKSNKRLRQKFFNLGPKNQCKKFKIKKLKVRLSFYLKMK
tara:strand:+ start:347 stop:562 length:216 start_codon:yes stop_codon:yes gene_type:complete